MDTLLLDQKSWDLVLDANNNIAVASNPYSLAQDAASAIKTFFGEVYFDTTIGIPYFTEILGKSAPTSFLQALFNKAAETVPDVASAQTAITEIQSRILFGQVQVVSRAGQKSVASFTVVSPQGLG